MRDLPANEMQILKKTGIPPVFAQLLKQKSQQLHLAIALRATTPMQRYLMPAAPKPLSVKAKTGNWCFTKGVISVDPNLGKIQKNNKKWLLIKRDLEDLPTHKDLLHTLLHHVSLQEILSLLEAEEIELIKVENHEIYLKPLNRFPHDKQFVFKINFNEDESRIEKQCPIDFTKMLIQPFIKETKPSWWQAAWGDFDECRNTYYPIQYKTQDTDVFKDILVYGLYDQTKKILPITGDQDLLWISIPSKQHESLFKEFEEVVDTNKQSDIQKLYKSRIALHLRLGGKIQDVDACISNVSLGSLGRVSAYESYVIDSVNQGFIRSGIKHLRNLIQHAAENHNPRKIVSIDARMVHVWKGQISMTFNENELIQFVLQKDFLMSNIVNVNALWDMNKWAPLIAEQITLKQPVLPDTIQALKTYTQKTQNLPFVKKLNWPNPKVKDHE